MHTEKILDDLIKKTMDEIDPIDLYRNKIIESVRYKLPRSPRNMARALDKDLKNKVHKLIKKEK